MSKRPLEQPQLIRDKWVSVAWMPHASLSNTSNVCMHIRSILTRLDELKHYKPEEWKVRVSLHGIGGLELDGGVHSYTTASPLESVRSRSKEEVDLAVGEDSDWPPLVSNVTHFCHFDSMIHVPFRWRDLPRDAVFNFEVLGLLGQLLYHGSLPLFSGYGKLHTGLMRVELHSPSETETRRNTGLQSPPAKSESEWQEDDAPWKSSRILDQLEMMEESKVEGTAQTGVSSTFGKLPSVPWLDKILRENCEREIEEAKLKAEQSAVYGEDITKGYLIVKLPSFDVPVMHEETFYPAPQHGPSGSVTPLDLALYRQKVASAPSAASAFDPLETIPFLDYENENDNPVEDKYRTLAHDLLRGLVDPALKPDRVQRDKLAAIIASPSHHPTREEKDLLWRFRFSLVDNRRALTKFLLAVDWQIESEVVQAAELLEQWRKRSPIEVTDALKLLGKQVAYQTNLVRAYAIDTLASAPDEELCLYLLQLVQALKFENIQETAANHVASGSAPVSSLATFLINRAAKNIQVANYLYWYLKVELQDPTHGARYREVFAELQSVLSRTRYNAIVKTDSQAKSKVAQTVTQAHLETESSKEALPTPFKSIVDSVSKFGSTLRGVEAPPPSQPDTPHLKEIRSLWDVLSAQDMFVSGVMDAQLSCGTKAKQSAKETHLRSVLSKEGYDRNSSREPFPLPCAPDVMVNGVNPQTAKVFKSAVYPALIEFHVESVADKNDFGIAGSRKRGSNSNKSSDGSGANARTSHQRGSYKVLVKTGDDLRQDQLAMVMIKLMDGLLKRSSLDLCVTPYSVIATSPTSGMVEIVGNSMPVSQILANHNGSILQFFQASAPQKGAKYDCRPDVVSTYVRSCAGYCVMTYILAIGDRHLDNILISKSGQFFHIDFGFMFGRDPKPLPPAFRLTREMVEGMGGLESSEYRQFCSLACQAFNALRKSAGLVLNLLHLMSDAGIDDLCNNPSADADGVIAKVEERFRLELTDEQAERYFLTLINDSLSAIAPRLMDVFHSIAVARR